ncbi:MAG: LppX_LprAFG lipoprotein [Chloroflexi bacterium]|nr:MAG: LppX_LprAFG lipoprotein [Chloroflexota bacterium]
MAVLARSPPGQRDQLSEPPRCTRELGVGVPLLRPPGAAHSARSTMMRAVACLGAALLMACSGSANVDAAKTLRDGGTAMGQLKTASATLKLTKGVISIQGFSLVNAKTSVRLPDDSDTIYTVKQQDVSIGLEVVITSGHVYLHVPFSTFQEVTGDQATAFPNMAKLFDPTTGLPAVIPLGKDPKYVSTDQVDGKSAYQVSTSYAADLVRGLLSELSSSGPVSARVWVNSSDHLIPKAVLTGAFGDGGTDATVEVDITGFDATVSITSPSIASPSASPSP